MLAEKDRTISDLREQLKGRAAGQQRIAELEAEIAKLRTKAGELRAWSSPMSFATMSAIAKALHPDHKPSEEQRAEACRLFTAWKAAKDKARRR